MSTPTDDTIKLFTGNANPELAREVADYLGLGLGRVTVTKFADGEAHVVIGESVRGSDVYLIQSLSRPVNDHIMELLVMMDALRRASARSPRQRPRTGPRRAAAVRNPRNSYRPVVRSTGPSGARFSCAAGTCRARRCSRSAP